MLAVPKYRGLELPIFDESREVLEPGIDTDRIGNESKFLRPITVVAPEVFDGLEKVLAVTDTELQVVADICGAEVINHQWGLIKRSNMPQDFLDALAEPECNWRSDLLPSGYCMVAEVDTLIPENDPSFLNGFHLSYDQIRYLANRLMDSYIRPAHALGYIILTDMWPEQFAFSKSFADEASSQPQVILHDIDCILGTV